MGHVRKVESGRWIARFQIGGGKQRSKTFDRKRDAELWLRGQEQRRDRGAWVDPKAGRVRFAVVADEWVELRSVAESTMARDASYLRSLILPTFGNMAVSDIDTEAVEAWIKSIDRSPATVHKAKQILEGVLNRAVVSKRITVNPATLAEGLPRIDSGEMRFLTRGEVGRLAEATGYESLVWVAARTGMRWAELVGLRYGNVNGGSIKITETVVEVGGRLITKGPKTPRSRRQIAIGPNVRAMIGDGDGLVFGPLRRSNFTKRVWIPATEAVGLGGVRFHDLRHTNAAWLIEAGHHAKVICDRLGHSSITVTMDRYGHLMEGLDSGAADSLDD